jgi:hypothetical protein
MDIKNLYDLANEADLKFDDDDGFQDATQVWIDGYMAAPEYLCDIWLDALAELHDKENAKKLTIIMEELGKSHDAINRANLYGKHSTALLLSSGSSMTLATAHLGQSVYIAVKVFVEAYVGKYAEEWWDDCVSYHSDMQEGQREDYLYQQHKDRMLEERE